MAPKTVENDADVGAYLAGVEPEVKREDTLALRALFERVTGEPAKMWGDSIVGFGSYRYTNTTGKEARWMLTGFAPRKTQLSVYIMDGFAEYGALLERLGKHKTAKSCLYIKGLSDVDMEVLEGLVGESVRTMRERYSS
ncbi:DUF1801 domain-containing protein [Parvularcula maris]|uniref:DUF1801 domain-containing protein n=1 Tax=Parvularcula maris TaxID=2965077 RepID=A0A9X2RKE3_9PROT|nr:DUF1801 domain-containing protein [Parvularcula maris]MCQ8185537.1 DUF1801 domain-containing protein [Parvularcula maris]